MGQGDFLNAEGAKVSQRAQKKIKNAKIQNQKMKNISQKVGELLFISGWILLLAHASQPFWSGDHVLRADSQSALATPITELMGGVDFAFHQKSKTGDVPKVMSLTTDANHGAFVLLIKNWTAEYDTRWSPGLMQHDGKRFLYALGERAPTRKTKSGSPTRKVASLPWARYEERVYDLDPGQAYFLLLPQHIGWNRDNYSIEIRQRKSGDHPFFLISGLIALGVSVLLLISSRKNGLTLLDPIKLARTYVAYGRTTEAKKVLQDALKKHPSRTVEIHKALAEME
jgi:hypothetical protein